MNNLPYKIHEYLTRNRRASVSEVTPTNITESSFSDQALFQSKEYPRMNRIFLSTPKQSQITLIEALKSRASEHTITQEKISFEQLSTILYSLSAQENGRRPYPSGGAKYPIETYVLIKRAENLEPGAYHYHPHTHSLEQLWQTPQDLSLFVHINAWAEDARVVILFSARWWRNAEKYSDFGYLLGMLECGHMAQNVLLSASSLSIPACPLAGFNDDRASEILDLDMDIEQPVYSIVLG